MTLKDGKINEANMSVYTILLEETPLNNEEGSINWFINESNKSPLCLISYKNDTSRYCKKLLLDFNLYYEELVGLGYKIYGYTTQSIESTKRLQMALLLKYPLISCQDTSLATYLLENELVSISISPINTSDNKSNLSDYNTEYLLNRSVLLINNQEIDYSWAYNSKSIKYPKAMHVIDKLNGFTYHKNSTPINSDFPLFPCVNVSLLEESNDDKNNQIVSIPYAVCRAYTSTCLPS